MIRIAIVFGLSQKSDQVKSSQHVLGYLVRKCYVNSVEIIHYWKRTKNSVVERRELEAERAYSQIALMLIILNNL